MHSRAAILPQHRRNGASTLCESMQPANIMHRVRSRTFLCDDDQAVKRRFPSPATSDTQPKPRVLLVDDNRHILSSVSAEGSPFCSTCRCATATPPCIIAHREVREALASRLRSDLWSSACTEHGALSLAADV
jgi:hypothetical protein